MLEAALSTSPVVTRLLVGARMRPQKHVSRAPPCRRNRPVRALCITISDDRGDESFADDLNMGRGIVSGRVALLLRSTEIRPHRPKDLLPLPSPTPPSRVTHDLASLPPTLARFPPLQGDLVLSSIIEPAVGTWLLDHQPGLITKLPSTSDSPGGAHHLRRSPS